MKKVKKRALLLVNPKARRGGEAIDATGDLGYELWVEPSLAVPLWDALFDKGEIHGIRPMGTNALEIARIEAGFLQAHVDFMPADQAIHPDRARSLVIAGCGYGAEPDKRAQFSAEAEASAKRFEDLTMAKAAEAYALGPTRVQHQNRDPRGWREFADQLKEHSTEGAALTMRGVQAKRPSLFELVDRMKAITAPTLVMTGDEDWPCIEPGILMKKNIATAGLVVMPNAGHNINLEDPAAFNAHLQELFLAADAGTWPTRDPRAMAGSILGK